jgi:hypothetical protein
LRPNPGALLLLLFSRAQKVGKLFKRKKLMPDEPKERGIWAERFVCDFLSLPLVREFVFHSPQTLDGTQKEVADFLIAYPGVSVLISQKTQKDPLSRTPEKTALWALKEAKRAASQLCGALRTAHGKPVWCEHSRRGRVELPEGLPAVNHGIVLVEVLERIDLNAEADDLPLQYQDTPITYLALNDFLNIAVELRTLPELLAYLDARRSLPYTDLRVIGDERPLFEFYLLHDGSLAGCVGKADAAITVAARSGELALALKSKWEHDKYSGLLEDVADQLATRRPDYAAGLSAEALTAYDAPDSRANYLKMQAVLANLGLRERAELGRAFNETIMGRAASGSVFSHRAMHVDSRPEWVYVVGSSAGIASGDLNTIMMNLMVGAMAHYQRTHCLLIIDREKASYEVGLMIRPSSPSSPTELAVGDKLFGHLRVTGGALTLVPGHSHSDA